MGYDQTHVTGAEQKNGTTNNAQNVDDRSPRSENLQNVLNVLQRSEDASKMCEENFALNNKKRSPDLKLLNSEFHNFINRDEPYETDYKAPNAKEKTFGVKYFPLEGKLDIVMPVKFMDDAILKDYGLISRKPTQDFEEAYMSSVERVWNQENSEKKYQLYLNAVNPEKNELCDTWANLNPVKVRVFAKRHENESYFYEVYYIPNSSFSKLEDALSFSNRTIAGKKAVVFTERAFNNRQADINDGGMQNTFAHEFGHQIGLGDEYTVNNHPIPEYTATLSDGTKRYPVYKEPELKVYERTEYNRVYILSNEGALFNHAGVDYFSERKTFNGGKTGYIIKEKDNQEHKLETPLQEELKYCKAVPATAADDGETYPVVYFYDRLLVTQKPGLRKYNLEKFCKSQTEMCHNSHRYKVQKKNDVDGKPFYYLVDEKGVEKKNFLDGMCSTHTQMVAEVFGEEYAWKNASKFDSDELGDQANQFGNKDYLMNAGNNIMPHHYITFEHAMVDAIQSDSKYGSAPSQKAPNMYGDWIIK